MSSNPRHTLTYYSRQPSQGRLPFDAILADLAPADLLFIDDSAANIDAAMDMGFHTHHFTDPARLRAAVERHGLL